VGFHCIGERRFEDHPLEKGEGVEGVALSRRVGAEEHGQRLQGEFGVFERLIARDLEAAYHASLSSPL